MAKSVHLFEKKFQKSWHCHPTMHETQSREFSTFVCPNFEPAEVSAVSKHSINKARFLQQHVYIQITFNTNGKNFITLLTQTPDHLLPHNQCNT